MTFFAYQLPPIDFGWDSCPTVEDYYATLAKDVFRGYARQENLNEFRDNFKTAKAMASDIGWEGDFRGEAHVFMMPDEDQFTYGFAWKQDNNGTTFVISPQPMPHLQRYG